MTASPLTLAAAAARDRRRRVALAFGTPGLLRLVLGGTWALWAVFLLAAGVGLDRHRHAVQTIGRDTAPSIIAAQQIRTSLAWAHADAARAVAGDPAAAGAYDGHRRDAADGMVAAAENITFGDAERGPIRRLVEGFGRYGAAVAVARATPADASRAALADAGRVLHGDLLPAADALDAANRDALDRGYADERVAAGWGTAWATAAGLLLVGGLVGGQVFLARRTRRTFNPALALSTVAAAALLVWLEVALAAAAEDLRSTKADAFDSVSALTRARAVAVDAYATRLAAADASVDADAGPADDGADLLASPPPGATLAAVAAQVDAGTVPTGFTGYLADELRNITYPGEQQAAADTLRLYAAYKAGPPAAAAAAFARFDDALGRTLEINQVAFEASVARGFADLAGLWGWSAAVAAAGLVLAYVGLRPRLREYAA